MRLVAGSRHRRDRIVPCCVTADSVNQYGNKPLHVAAYHGSARIAGLLIEQGATVNAKGRSGQSALHFAARQGHAVVVDLLVGQHPHLTPRPARPTRRRRLTPTSRPIAVAGVRCCRADNGIDVNELSDLGYSALHFAAFSGHDSVIVPLIMAGTSVNLAGKDQATPLHLAAQEGFVTCVNILLGALRASARTMHDGVHRRSPPCGAQPPPLSPRPPPSRSV